MHKAKPELTFSDQLAEELPYLRRYARALTGSQSHGDKYTVNTLKEILVDRRGFNNMVIVRPAPAIYQRRKRPTQQRLCPVVKTDCEHARSTVVKHNRRVQSWKHRKDHGH